MHLLYASFDFCFKIMTIIVAEIQGSQKPEGWVESGLVELPENSTIYIKRKYSLVSLARNNNNLRLPIINI